MTTTISKKETLINTRNEWDAKNAEQKAKYEAQYENFRNVQNEVFETVKNQVLASLAGVNLNLEVTVDSGYSLRKNSVEVRVKSNDNRVHAEDKALSWSWDVSLGEDGAVSKKSSSWSGLQATTAEQVESLRQTVNALEILNALDWSSILNVELPDWSEYITEKSSIGQRPNFEADIRAAEVAELIGTSTLIKGAPNGGRRRGAAWYLIVSESPKQFKVAELSNYSVQEQYLAERGQTLAQAVEQAKKWTTAITKEKFLNDILDRSMETMTF
jgi:hypothetical protein